MRKSIGAVILILLTVIAAGQSEVEAQLLCQDLYATVEPDPATASSPLTVRITGTWSNTGLDIFAHSFKKQGSVLKVAISIRQRGEVWTPLVTPWEVTEEMGVLSAGTYLLEVKVNDCLIKWGLTVAPGPAVSGTIYNKYTPQHDTFTISNLGACEGLHGALADLPNKQVRIDVGPYSKTLPGDMFVEQKNGTLLYYRPGKQANEETFKFQMMPDAEKIALAGSKVILDGIENPITVRVTIEDWFCEAIANWSRLNYSGGVRYHLP